MDCPFCRIAIGAAPARVVHETSTTISFFPLRPELLAHTLIVPKQHFGRLEDCPAATGAAVFGAAQGLARLYADRLAATGFNLLNANGQDAEQSVPHLHFHFLPRWAGDGISAWPKLPPFETDLDALLARLT